MYLVTPRCPACSSFRNLSLITFGMIIHVDFRSRPFSTVSSSLNVQYGCASFRTSLIHSGHPVVTMCFNSDSSSSLAVSNLISWITSSWLDSCWVMALALNLGRTMMSLMHPSWLRQSATWFVGPGVYLTLKSYALAFINSLCNLGSCFIEGSSKDRFQGFLICLQCEVWTIEKLMKFLTGPWYSKSF